MSIAEAQAKSYVTRSASDLAFQVGQLTSRLLIERAILANRGRQESPLLITEDDVKTVLTPAILEAVIAQIEAPQDEEADDREGRLTS